MIDGLARTKVQEVCRCHDGAGFQAQNPRNYCGINGIRMLAHSRCGEKGMQISPETQGHRPDRSRCSSEGPAVASAGPRDPQSGCHGRRPPHVDGGAGSLPAWTRTPRTRMRRRWSTSVMSSGQPPASWRARISASSRARTSIWWTRPRERPSRSAMIRLLRPWLASATASSLRRAALMASASCCAHVSSTAVPPWAAPPKGALVCFVIFGQPTAQMDRRSRE